MATFSDEDVVVANSYSKSLRRTVAQEWTAARQYVHYFPSYEIAQNSIAQNSESHRGLGGRSETVRGEVVQRIMRIFLGHYPLNGGQAPPLGYLRIGFLAEIRRDHGSGHQMPNWKFASRWITTSENPAAVKRRMRSRSAKTRISRVVPGPP